MLKKSLVILIFALGLTVGFSARAASGTCPSDNGEGEGCNIGIGEYYCLSACRTGQTQCPDWTGTVCASQLTCPTNCATADSCGYCNSCSSGYTLCGSYPSQTCTANTTPPSNCSSYNQCTAVCSACAQGYELVDGLCIGATLKLGSDSVGALNHIFQSTSPSLYVLSSGYVGIGTSTPTMALSIVPTSGYSILAGNFKIGNVALPTTDADAATKGYVDSTVSSATSSMITMPIGTSGQTLRHDGTNWLANSVLYNDGTNVGIGTTTPSQKLEVSGTSSPMIKVTGTSTGHNDFTTVGVYNGTGGGFFRAYGQSFGVSSLANKVAFGNDTTVGSTGLVVFGNSSVTSGGVGTISFRSGGYDTAAENLLLDKNGSYFSHGLVGIGTTTPTAALSIVPASGYSILAGNFKIGNVALPTVDADAATKGYVDSTIASATSSITLWGGTTGGDIWNLNSSGNVGIGTTTPTAKLNVIGTFGATASSSSIILDENGNILIGI